MCIADEAQDRYLRYVIRPNGGNGNRLGENTVSMAADVGISVFSRKSRG